MLKPRRILAVGALLVSALALTGCLNLEVDTSVSATGTFTGNMTTTFDRQTVGEFGITDLSQAQEELGVPDATGENVSVQWSETDTAFVQTVSFTDATPAEIEAATTSSTESAGPEGTSQSMTAMTFPLTAEASADTMVVSLSDDAASAGSEAGLAEGQSAKQAARIGRMLFGDSSVTIEVTMPGPITDVTGAIPKAAKTNSDIVVAQPDPTRFEFGASFVALGVLAESADGGDALVITSSIDPALANSATSSAAPSAAQSDQTQTQTEAGLGPLLWVAAAVVLILIALGVAVALSRRSRNQG